MSSSTDNVRQKKNINSATIDDSWVICDSTSYPGLKFYVNKLTGIKVWNITESEIAFAEKADKNCSEPQRRPTMDQPEDSRIYNSQVINNQFSNHLSNFMVNSVPVCSPFNIWETPPLNQVQPQEQTYTLVPTALIKAYRQLIPLSNNLQNATLPISYDAQKYVPNQTPNRMCQTARYRKNKWYRSNERFQNQTSRNNELDLEHTQKSDLRKKLVRRRSLSEFCVAKDKVEIGNESSTRNDINNWNEQDWEETSIQMNLTPLKLLTSSDSDSDQWYIVVDTDVILKNFNYLNNMAAADPDCHLFIPHHVMTELRTHVSESSNVQARRILRFLTQQIDSGLAILGVEVAGQSATQKIITTCVQLASQNNHVVLITNTPNIFDYKFNTKDIHVYTIQDIKGILTNRLPTPRVISPTLAVKITVPNVVRGKSIPRDEFPAPTSQRNFDSTELADTGINTTIHSKEKFKTNLYQGLPKRTLDMQSMKSSSDCNQGTPKAVVKVNKPVGDGVNMNINSVDNSADCNQSPPNNTLGIQSMNNPADCNQGLSNSMVKGNKPVGDGVYTNIRFTANPTAKSTLGVQSMKNPADCNQETAKSVVKGNKPADAGVYTKMNPEGNSKADCNLSPPNSMVKDKKLAYSGVNTLAVNSVRNSKADCNRSPSKSVAKGGYELPDNESTKSAPGVYTVGNLEHNNRTPPNNPTNNSSLCSSSPASGKVSLDTICMKRIISMKNLVSTERSQKIRQELATNILAIKSTAIVPQTIQRTTLRSESDNTSEASVVKKIVGPNVTIVEPSTSGVISNSESSYSDKVKGPIKNDDKKEDLRNVVMYEVACQSMEDVLKTRCDEWVFRFIQIMEEVLRVKLQEKLTNNTREFPAPRDLKEASKYIIQKFCDDFDVVNAANKLAFILYKTSDKNGKIAVNIQPSDYMKMYTYGMFLVETFQDMSVKCNEKDCKKEKTYKLKEDEADSCSCYEVKTAYESLKQLLYDIQNANLDSTFVDQPCELSKENPNPDYSDNYDIDTEEMLIPETAESSHDQQDEMQCDNDSYNLYNLRSQKRKSQIPEHDEVPSKITNTSQAIETTFFNSLHLTKTFNTNESDSHKDDKDLKNVDKQNAVKTKHVETEEKQNEQNPVNIHTIQHSFRNEGLANISKSPSKVIRHFTINEEFEKKIKARLIERKYEEDGYVENEEFYSQDKIGNGILTADESKTGENNNCTNNESNTKFVCFMGRLTRRLGDVFTQVKLLCDDYVNEIKNKKQCDAVTGNELHLKLEMACLLIGNIHQSLESISKRDTLGDKGKIKENIQTLLKIANVEDYIPDEKLCTEYRCMIIKCKEKAEEFYNNVRSISKIIHG